MDSHALKMISKTAFAVAIISYLYALISSILISFFYITSGRNINYDKVTFSFFQFLCCM